ncbi:MAG: HDIG domain-containing protein [Pirellulales bacterium]
MASGSPIRTRSDRVAMLAGRPAAWRRWWHSPQRDESLRRLALCALTVLTIWALTRGWSPPFAYRTGAVPRRDIVARVKFSVRDDERTRLKKEQVRRDTPCFYINDPAPLRELREQVLDKVSQLVAVDAAGGMPAELEAAFFARRPGDPPPMDAAVVLPALRQAFAAPEALSKLGRVVGEVLAEHERFGLLEDLDERQRMEAPNHQEIRVHPPGHVQQAHLVPVRTVRLSDVRATLERRLADALRLAEFSDPAAQTAARLIGDWLRPRLPVTLSYNQEASVKARESAAADVDANPEINTFEPGRSTLAEGGKPIGITELRLLMREHDTLLEQRTWQEIVGYAAATWSLYAGVFILCGLYMGTLCRGPLLDFRQFATLLGAAATTVALAWFFARDQWRAESVPVMLFALAATIAYPRELALLLSLAAAMLVTLALGQGLAHFLILGATAAVSVLLTGRIRTRTRLIYVGLAVAVASFLVALCVGRVMGQAYGAPQLVRESLFDSIESAPRDHLVNGLLSGAGWSALCAMIASILMTGVLPFIERIFDVQTDMSLLELGDARHPLLQELVRRAPGTYNHSINVASIGEAAAESIGANSLLVRVGAYFHDIGKMLKPQYFVENQGQEANRHQSLVPAMSTLVIIAHVKDGADLARQHHLPQSLIDFIEQHHGTTLVEYFYRQAAKQVEDDPDGVEVEESHFRYPGPRPQTRETAILMLADAVESASRTLVDPTPSRIENLVHEIAMKRLLDDQFSDCGLTLQELHAIEQSLIKSITAVYHGRVKYPDQQLTA